MESEMDAAGMPEDLDSVDDNAQDWLEDGGGSPTSSSSLDYAQDWFGSPSSTSSSRSLDSTSDGEDAYGRSSKDSDSESLSWSDADAGPPLAWSAWPQTSGWRVDTEFAGGGGSMYNSSDAEFYTDDTLALPPSSFSAAYMVGAETSSLGSGDDLGADLDNPAPPQTAAGPSGRGEGGARRGMKRKPAAVRSAPLYHSSGSSSSGSYDSESSHQTFTSEPTAQDQAEQADVDMLQRTSADPLPINQNVFSSGRVPQSALSQELDMVRIILYYTLNHFTQTSRAGAELHSSF